ncbi:hypothetical protein BKA66DRAFT_209176 [Pyrenochaeta sp. MPI-SDFR-AT-0127]|nr:hypothetical protein BKA66DRAFT_209176 [Pyrenochaeta sp. MPI-SDFR-AT-0127]
MGRSTKPQYSYTTAVGVTTPSEWYKRACQFACSALVETFLSPNHLPASRAFCPTTLDRLRDTRQHLPLCAFSVCTRQFPTAVTVMREEKKVRTGKAPSVPKFFWG